MANRNLGFSPLTNICIIEKGFVLNCLYYVYLYYALHSDSLQ